MGGETVGGISHNTTFQGVFYFETDLKSQVLRWTGADPFAGVTVYSLTGFFARPG